MVAWTAECQVRHAGKMRHSRPRMVETPTMAGQAIETPAAYGSTRGRGALEDV